MPGPSRTNKKPNAHEGGRSWIASCSREHIPRRPEFHRGSYILLAKTYGLLTTNGFEYRRIRRIVLR